MSQENVEDVRRFLLLEVDEALTYVDPATVFYTPRRRAVERQTSLSIAAS